METIPKDSPVGSVGLSQARCQKIQRLLNFELLPNYEIPCLFFIIVYSVKYHHEPGKKKKKSFYCDSII